MFSRNLILSFFRNNFDMEKIYQPIVIEKTNLIIGILENENFFKENEIENTEFAKNYISDRLTEKFIDGKIDEDFLFTEDEMENHLKLIIVGSTLYEIKKKGFIDSYEDDTTEEVFFLTQKGKDFLNENYDKLI